MPKILITGAAGRIGSFLAQYLSKSYKIRRLDICPMSHDEDKNLLTNNIPANFWLLLVKINCLAGIIFLRESHIWLVDITDFEALLPAMKSVDVVIHLAANPSPEQTWQDVYGSGISGTYNVFEAARQSGIRKIIYASSNLVSGCSAVKQGQYITSDMPVRPDSLYAVGKLFGESLGRFFADKYQMSILCLRIGSFQANPKPRNVFSHLYRTWCSPRDLGQLVELILQRDNLGFQIFYAVSGNKYCFWDISNAEQLLGYKPQDKAEDLLTKNVF